MDLIHREWQYNLDIPMNGVEGRRLILSSCFESLEESTFTRRIVRTLSFNVAVSFMQFTLGSHTL